MKMKMFICVNYQRRLLLAPDSAFYTGLPKTHAGYFAFGSEKEAKAAAKRYSAPKLQVVPVCIENGFPTPWVAA